MSDLTVFLNGRYVPYEQAVVPVEDRAFTFADAVYEVIACYGGRPFRLDLHLERLRQSAEALEIRLPYSPAEFERVVRELLRRNRLEDASVYLQVSRGVAPRNLPFPERARPTVVGIARALQPASEEDLAQGVRAITTVDHRWGLCHVKTVGLLPNVLARQAAHRQGANEAVFVRDGLVTEGASSNVFCVLGDTVYTHPLVNILAGVTRTVVLEILAEEGLPVREEAVSLNRFRQAGEIFITSTRRGVRGVTELDGQPVGDGKVGSLTLRLGRAYRKRTLDVARPPQ